MPFSVLIIIKGRRDHLTQVLAGIARSAVQPQEIVVLHMNEPSENIPCDIPLKQYELQSGHTLPLAQARNLAAAKASTDTLVFLDVDCIPAPDCFGQLLDDLNSADLVMADPAYLSRPVARMDFDELEHYSRPNPARQKLEFGHSTDYEMFWSLGFALKRSAFERIGGFDEAMNGYGGEDTDFAFRARQADIRLFYSRARLYHQNHPSYDPPLNWLEDIVTNARYFKDTWGIWPMQGWLHKFEAMGLIIWTDRAITVERLPTADEITACKKSDAL